MNKNPLKYALFFLMRKYEKNPFFWNYLTCLWVSVSLLSCTPDKDETRKQIEKNLEISKTLYIKQDNLSSLEYAKKAYKLSKINPKEYRTEVAKSSLDIALAVSGLGLDNIALKYIEEARKYCDKEDYLLYAELDNLEAYIFTNLDLTMQAKDNYYKVIHNLEKHKNEYLAKKELYKTYQNLGTIYFDEKRLDSLDKYNGLTVQILPYLSETNDSDLLLHYYFNAGQDYLYANNRTSALNMFQKCKFLDSINYKKSYGVGDLGLAVFYEKEDPQKSLSHYFKVIKKIDSLKLNLSDMNSVFNRIAQIYADMGDKENQEKYLELYNQKVEAQKVEQKKAVDKAIAILMNKQNEDFVYKKSKIIMMSTLVTLVLVVLLYIIIRRAKKRNKILELHLQESNQKVEVLKNQVNESFGELVDMAKNNSPHFFTRFKEVYPHFLNKLITLNPDFKPAELEFCAYLYLGFSTKEIANCTFKSLKTIENKRYNVRKKVNIVPEIHLETWLKDYIDV
ncbi:hypothetical protein [Chryseobacterium sp.]|uniref:helix-turn-helix transcriptional regulator n=1 Tax=Chryseobacterium sp. TaxID=1871047 RepID=UPI0023F55CCA|nr:hypothetical protein [Chryseobacterium sp.]